MDVAQTNNVLVAIVLVGSDRVVAVIDRDRNDFSQNCRGHWHH